MQVNETLNEGLKRGYTITVTAAELEAKVTAKLTEAQPDVEMKGFRKGKVPLPLLRKQFGQRLLGEAMQESIDAAMSEHFEKSGDRPALQPDVKMTNEDWKEGQDIEVAMHYEALPEIPDVAFSEIALEKMVVRAEESEIDSTLSRLADNAKSYADREEGDAAQKDDQITMDFLGKVDGEAFEGGSAEDYPLVLGSNSFIPGFEDQLIGAKSGDKKTVEVTFPEDYNSDALKGKDAVFECKIKGVKAPQPAPVDDDLAKNFGLDSLDDLKTNIRERLEGEYSGAARSILKRKLLDALDESVKFDLPPSLVTAEAKQIAHQMWHDENPEEKGHNHDEIEPNEEQNTLAERRVRLGLLLAEIGRKAELAVTDAEFSQALMQQAQQFPGQEKEFFEFIRENQQMQQQIRAPLFEDKVVDYICELAQISENEVSRDDLQKAVEELEAE